MHYEYDGNIWTFQTDLGFPCGLDVYSYTFIYSAPTLCTILFYPLQYVFVECVQVVAVKLHSWVFLLILSNDIAPRYKRSLKDKIAFQTVL